MSPDSTTDSGPLTAATDSSPGSTWSNGRGTDTIPPRPASVVIALLRNATTRAASASDNAPATQAAAISPCECPTTAAGTTPYERHNAARDTITANNAGCTTSTRDSN